MRQLGPALSALFILWCAFTVSAQGDFASIDEFSKATLKGEDKISVQATGDLNGDGMEDWTGVVERRKADASPTTQLYVLLRQAQGGYRVAEQSKEEMTPGMGCCWVESLEIKRASIYIQNNAKTASTMEAATHQFKLVKDSWRLVGLRIYYLDLSTDTSAETDMNLLTGSVVEKKQKGEKKPITKRRSKKFPTSLLKDFDFSNGFGAE